MATSESNRHEMSAVEFRCEQCGKLLGVEARDGQVVQCPHCGKRMTVPPGLASLPRPLVARDESPAEAPQEELAQEAAISRTMTSIMPWVLSVFLHLGVGLIAGFVTTVYVQHVNKPDSGDVIYVPGNEFSQDVSGITNPGDPGSEDSARQHEREHAVTGYSHNESTECGAVGETGKVASVISVAGGGGLAGGGWAKFGPNSGGTWHGPRSSMYHTGCNAHHVVYCIDASGSMAFASRNGGSIFDAVRAQMLYSIGRLADVQDFHVVMFQEGTPIELPAKRLQPVTMENRSAAAQWLNGVVPHGAGSDPIPALNRCFDVLARADTTRKGKQIFLLTDGAFPNNDAVLKCVRERNKARDVHVFTFLYGQQEDESIIRVMRDIAVGSGGIYKNIME